MTFLHARHLLQQLAHAYQQGRQPYSRQEIVSKMNEIKYLSAQKKIPKLTLRKEIIHLENKLQAIFELEKHLAEQKRREAAKEAALKRQIQVLKKKAAAAEDKDLQRKVEKLSHLLGECLAKAELRQDVALTEQVVKELKESPKKKRALMPIKPPQNGNRVQELQQRLSLLKSRAANHEDPTIQEKIAQLEKKLQQQVPSSGDVAVPEVEVAAHQVKHTLLFGKDMPLAIPLGRKEGDEELERELPLPPPPRIKKQAYTS